MDILRRSKKNADIPLDDTWNRIPGGKLTEDEAISDINAEIITSRILSLPNIYRDVFLLYYSNGYSVRQIAKALGISYDAAKKRLQRAKMVLNQYLRKEGIV